MKRGPHPAATARTTPAARRGRSLLERLGICFPGLLSIVARVVYALPRSRLRTALINYGYRRTYAAYGRGDWELNTVLLDREDYVFQPRGAGPGIVVGARETYLDVEGYMEVVSDWAEAFSEAQFLFEGAIEIDRHRSAALVRIVGVGSGSGIQVARTALDVHELRRGTVVRQTFWWDRDAGLRSLGLMPPAQSK